jgi:hypothetical protein
MLYSLRAHANGRKHERRRKRAAVDLTDFKVLEMPKVLAITTAGFSILRKDLVG